MRTSVIGLATLLVGAASLLPASTAQADSLTVVDATADMATYGESGLEIDSTHSNGDVSEVLIRHTLRQVVVRTSYAELDPTDGGGIIQAVRIRTSKGEEFFQRTSYGAGGPSPELRTAPPDLQPVQCNGLRATGDTTADMLRVQFPRTCINRPRWIKVVVTSIHYFDNSTQWYDDAHKPTAYVQDEWVYTTRIRKPL